MASRLPDAIMISSKTRKLTGVISSRGKLEAFAANLEIRVKPGN